MPELQCLDLSDNAIMDGGIRCLCILMHSSPFLFRETPFELIYLLSFYLCKQFLLLPLDKIVHDIVCACRSLIPYFIWALLKDYPLTDIKLNNCNLSCTGVANLLRSLPPLNTPLNTFSVAENELGRQDRHPCIVFPFIYSVNQFF